jgi:hypothetical protein
MPLPEVHPPHEVTDDLGCFVFMAIFAVFGTIVAFATEIMWLIVPVVLITLALAIFIAKQKIGIHLGIRYLQAEEQIGLLVYSDSPLWKSHIESEWLPRFGPRVAVLNFSERRNWDPSDPLVQMFNGVADADRDFSPLVVMLRKDRRPLLFTFDPAFRLAKFGNREGLEGLERQMFGMAARAAVGVIRTIE